MKALFWRDTHHTIKGEMLMRTFESILDFIRAGGDRGICVPHDVNAPDR